MHCIISFSLNRPTEKQQVTKPKPLPRTGIQLYDSQEQVTPKPAQPTTAEWDGKKIHEIVFHGDEALTFDDVWKILREKKFAKFEEIFQQNPNIVNSLRYGGYGQTLLMWAVLEDRFDVFVHLMECPQDFSLVDNDGWNVLHYVGYHGKVRHLEKFDQQTIKMLIDGRDK
uniref:Uncharacterized protein n=1 Tax=Clytia hemisphaerica TaxID=252671 RepID=A0A7M5V2T9_9CNID